MKRLFAVLISAMLILSGSAVYAAEVGEETVEEVGAQAFEEDEADGEAVGAEASDEVSAQISEEVAAQTSEEEGAAAYPSIRSLENTSKGVKATWSPFAGASRYRLYIRENNRWIKVVETTDIFAEYSGAADGQSLLFTVRALDSNRDFCSSYYTMGWTHTYYAAPKVEAECDSSGALNIAWNAASGASYEVVRRIGGAAEAGYKKIIRGGRLIENVAGLENLSYAVSRLDSSGRRVSAAGVSNTISPCEIPRITKIENSSKGALIYFDKSENAPRTRIYHRVGSRWVKLGETAENTFLYTSPIKNEEELYTVRCIDNNRMFCSGYNGNGFKSIFYAAPEFTSTVNTEKGVTLRWNAPENTKSRVYRDGALIAKTDGGVYIDSEAEGGRTYTYYVRIYDNYARPLSPVGVKKSHTFVAQPAFTSIENTLEGVKLSWDACEGAAYYRVYVNDGGKWINQLTTSDTSYLDTKAESGEGRLYTIRALDSKKSFVTEYNRSGWLHTFYAAPKLLEVKRSGNGVVISWEEIEGISEYRVYRRLMGGSWSRLTNSVGATSFTDTTRDPEKLYSYTVRCLDGEGNVVSGYIRVNPYYRDGKLVKGFVESDGKKYYSGEDGEYLRNQIVGSKEEGYAYVGEDGAVCESEEIKLAVDFVLKNAKGKTSREKLRSCFYALISYPYVTRYHFPNNGEEYRESAAEMFREKGGNCFSYGGAFASVAKVLGYEARASRGSISMAYGGMGPHGWAEVKIGGVWYICDPDMQKYSSSTDSYYLVTLANYPVAPFYREKSYTIRVKGGQSVWK